MQAVDVMTKNVVSVEADAEVREIASLLLKHRISAVPVIDANGHVIGLVSEGDLMRRAENDTEERHAWWLAKLLSTHDNPAEYIKSHGRKAADVMTRDVITVTEDKPLHEIAALLERNHIKRVPVVRDRRLVGIISRANLLHGLATSGGGSGKRASASDRELREKVMKEMTEAAGVDARFINATVKDGVVQLWGVLYSATEQKAAEVAAQNVPGVKSVENNIGLVPPWTLID